METAGEPGTVRRPQLPDIDLSTLRPEDLHRVRSFLEHELGNIICPLAIRLQMEAPGTKRCDPTLQTAERTVARIAELVATVKRLDDAAWIAAGPAQGAGGGA
jgi:hypothetical protein